MKESDKIVITGGYGLLGTALAEYLKKIGFNNVTQLSSKDCNLTKLDDTVNLFIKLKPDYVFHCAALVKGVMGSLKNQAESFFLNTLINTNTIHACYKSGVKKVVAIGTGAIYAENVTMPLQEKDLWVGQPHISQLGYGHAKRHMLAQLYAYNDSYGLKYSFILSPNLYGPNDRFDTEQGGVIPSLVRKFYEALNLNNNVEVTVWGTGAAKRDFLFVEDMARALVTIMNNIDGEVNVGSGVTHTIKDVVNYLDEITGHKVKINWDTTKPNGQDARFYDLSKLQASGFKPLSSLREGLEKTFKWYENNHETARKK